MPSLSKISKNNTTVAPQDDMLHRTALDLLNAQKRCFYRATAHVSHRGREDFERSHEATYSHNAGSRMFPAAFGYL